MTSVLPGQYGSEKRSSLRRESREREVMRAQSKVCLYKISPRNAILLRTRELWITRPLARGDDEIPSRSLRHFAFLVSGLRRNRSRGEKGKTKNRIEKK